MKNVYPDLSGEKERRSGVRPTAAGNKLCLTTETIRE